MDALLTAPGLRGTFAPQMMTLFVLFVALRWKERMGAVTGFLIGIILSGIYGERAGLLSCALVLVGYFTGWVSPFLRESPRPVLFFFAFFVLVILDILIGTLLSLIGTPFFRFRIGSAFTSALVFALVYPWLEKFFAPEKQPWFAQKDWT